MPWATTARATRRVGVPAASRRSGATSLAEEGQWWRDHLLREPYEAACDLDDWVRRHLDDEAKVRLLEIVDGGFLGLGKESRLVPVELVRSVDEDQVVVDRDRQTVIGAPAYDPELTDAPDYFTNIYDYYEVGPFWTPGALYRPPPFRP